TGRIPDPRAVPTHRAARRAVRGRTPQTPRPSTPARPPRPPARSRRARALPASPPSSPPAPRWPRRRRGLSPDGAVEDLKCLEVGVEVERVVAALPADSRDARPPERRGQVSDQEGVDPHEARTHGAADPVRAPHRARVDDP